MRALRLVVGAAAVGLALVPTGGARLPARPVAIFYYPWYGAPRLDGAYEQWSQNGHAPPGDLYSAYYPSRGAYSSSNRRVVDRQMAEIAGAGIDEVITSWWGPGSQTDQRLPLVLAAARRHGLSVAVHVEPYPGRTAQSVDDDVTTLARRGITDFYVFAADEIPAADWLAARTAMPGVRLFAQTGLVGFAQAGGFDGVYTYDIVTYDGGKFARYCDEAHRVHLLCEPSVGPGYDALRADGDAHVKARRRGATYDAMWSAALAAAPDAVTITSYNEWGEGTQIEPARPRRGYRDYRGAWGMSGAAAAGAYLERTGYWTGRFRARR
jgi:glycoprotein endo-alpha-1,2-mannosidase